MAFNQKIGLGTFPFSNVFSTVTHELAEKIVDQFINLGGEYIETAPVYPVKIVDLGKILKNFKRTDYFLATKCVTGTGKDGTKYRSGSHDFLLSQLHDELKRLDVDYFDLIQAHIIPTDVSIQVLAQNLQKLKESKLVKEIGVSNVNLGALKIIADNCDVTFVQNRFSLIHQSLNRDIEDFAIKKNIKLNPYQIIERGLLTGNPSKEKKWEESDIRNSKFEYNNEQYSEIHNWVCEKLIPISNELGIEVEKLICFWTNHQKGVELSVVGFTHYNQVEKLLPMSFSERILDSINKLDVEYSSLCSYIKNKYNLSLEEFRGLK